MSNPALSNPNTVQWLRNVIAIDYEVVHKYTIQSQHPSDGAAMSLVLLCEIY